MKRRYILIGLIGLLLFSGCLSKSRSVEVEYIEVSKPWPGSEQACFDLAKQGFDEVCNDILLKETPLISCERWWDQTEIYQGEVDGKPVCIMRIPKALKTLVI